uniref:Uncharacterized protein n=1 Tax=Oryza glumipatula TaxID=40148 RepID=A0A0E0A7V6_9ORYZ
MAAPVVHITVEKKDAQHVTPSVSIPRTSLSTFRGGRQGDVIHATVGKNMIDNHNTKIKESSVFAYSVNST